MITVLLMTIVAVIVLIAVVYRTRRRRPIILGMEQARADAVEAQRLARGTSAASPMPKEEYAPRHHNHANPQPVALDHAIRELVVRYGASDAVSRTSIRDSITGDEIYTLVAYAKRAAAFGMRDRDPSWIESGLTAVAMLEGARMDMRDVPMTLAFLHHASGRAGADTASIFAQAAELADGDVAAQLRAYPDRNDTDLMKHWGAIETPTGFIGHGGERWAPTRDLQQAILRIAAVVDADGRYEVSGVEIAGTLPFAWFTESTRLLRNARGGATFQTSLMNGLMGFLVEMPGAEEAAALQHASLGGTKSIGFARGNLFCFLKAADETPQALQRFVAPIAEVLDTTS
jgi:hypothetical protein